MALEVDTGEYIDNYGSLEFRYALKTNQIRKWFFHISYNASFVHTGTFYQACEAVKKHFKNSNNANYGIIKLSKIENIN